MTCRDLIVYILSNNLEDEQVFKDGKFVGFITVAEAAERANVGIATVYAWIRQGKITSVSVGNEIYIPADFASPISERSKGERNE